MPNENTPGVELSDSDWEQKIQAEQSAVHEVEEAKVEQPKKRVAKPRKKAESHNDTSVADPQSILDSDPLLAGASTEENPKTDADETPVATAEDEIPSEDLICMSTLPDDEEKGKEEFTAILQAAGTTSDQQRETASTPGTPAYILMSAEVPNANPLSYSHTDRATESAEDLKNIFNNNQTLEFASSSDTSSGPKEALGGQPITGDAAVLSTIARIQGLRKVYLFNSGFSITIRPLTLAELTIIYMSMDEELQELGRMFGSFSYMAADEAIRAKVMEILPAIVIRSNLKGYERDGVLARNISIHDYDTILWAILTMMYRDGFKASLQCTNPDCLKQDIVDIDISRIRLNCFDRLPDKAREFIMSNQPVSEQELTTYRTKLLDMSKTITKRINKDTEVIVTTQVPVLSEYLSVANSLLSKLFSLVNGEKSIRNTSLLRLYGIQATRMFLPWVERLQTSYQGKPDINTVSKPAILAAMESVFTDEVVIELEKYVSETRISHFCFTNIKCSKCGRTPAQDVRDFHPIDVEQLFFALSSLRLRREE